MHAMLSTAIGLSRKIVAETAKACFSTSTNLPRKKVVVTAKAFEETYQSLTNNGLEVTGNATTEPWKREELIAHARDAHAMLAFMTDSVDEAFLDACPDLELIACALKGFDNFDIQKCAERGVAVTAVPDLLTAPTAELAVLLALGLGRRILQADENVRSGAFQGWRPTLYGTGLAGTTVGIYGAGAVGQAVAQRIVGFGLKRMLYVDPDRLDPQTEGHLKVEAANSIGDLLQTCDFLFVCTPLNESTYHVINQKALSQAKPGLMLINISRGSCVEEAAVVGSLESGQLAGYAADVFEFEDWILENRPKSIHSRLHAHPRTLFSPHLGSAVRSTRRGIEQAAADEILRWSRGEDYLYRVN